MSRSTPIPYFPVPPQQYNPAYFAEIARSFSVYAQQMNTPGPWRATSLTLTPTGEPTATGVMTYDAVDDTINLTHLNGVNQQIGMDLFLRAENDTGSTIEKGSVVGYTGAGTEVTISKYIANSAAEELFFLGLAMFDMADGDIGNVLEFGTIRGIDTTGQGGETWVAGDLLFVSPTTAGALTNVRPTAPNLVIEVGVVTTVDAANGEILVKPNIPVGLDYGTFNADIDQTIGTINTATAVTLQNTELSNGIALSSGSRLTVAKGGFYQIDVSGQLLSTTASQKQVYFWLRKNGTDVSNTTRALSLNLANGLLPVTLIYTISLAASDYIEIYWAADNTNVRLDARAATAFAPTGPSVIVHVNQLQL